MLNKGKYGESVLYRPPMKQHREYSRLSYQYLAEKSLYALFQDDRVRQDVLCESYLLKEQELVDRISGSVPKDMLLDALNDVLCSLHGVIGMDLFEREMNVRLGQDLRLEEMLEDWLYSEHRQFF